MGLLSSPKTFSRWPWHGARRWFLEFAAIVIALSGSRLAPATAEPVTWRVQMFLNGQENWLSVEGHGLYADFSRAHAWTLRNLRFRGTELVGPYGANGSVVHLKTKTGDSTDPWIGTSHGKERIESFDVVVDGQQLAYQPGRTYSGSRVVLEKYSRLGPLEHRAEIVFAASGDRISEKHGYTVIEELNQRLDFLYVFMHCNNNRLNQWLAVLSDGKELRGEVVRDDASFVLKRDVRAVVFYNARSQVGATYVYPEVYRGGGDFGTAIWDRKSDNKLYFRPDVPREGLNIGDRLEYQVELIPYTAKPDQWEATGRRLASQ